MLLSNKQEWKPNSNSTLLNDIKEHLISTSITIREKLKEKRTL